MKLSESEKQNPQDYFLQSVDDEGNPVGYDDVNQEVTDYAPAKAFRKKVFDGTADIVVLSDTVQIYWKENLVAEAQLEGQVETSPGVWQGQLFSFADANVQKITEVEGEDRDGNPIMVPVTPFFRAYEVKDIPALGIVDAVFGLDVHWAFKDTKLSFYLDAPGFNARIRWQCRVKDSAVAWTDNSDPENSIHHRGLSFSVSDYEGNVNHGSQADPEPGWTQHWWTFEPDGKLIDAADARTPLERYEQGVGLVVDPYLSVDEQSTYIDVYCDGYYARIRNDETDTCCRINETSTDEEMYHISDIYIESATIKRTSFDTSRAVTVIENTPSRVKIMVKGLPTDDTQASDLVNCNYTEWIFTIYPDKISWEYKISMSSSSTPTNMGMCLIQANGTNLDNEALYYEDGGDETEETGDNYRNSAKYGLHIGDQINAQFINLYNNLQTLSYTQHFGTTTSQTITFGVGESDTLGAGISILINCLIFDSDERQGSAKIYDETDRLALGDQYKDLEIDLTEGGSRIFSDESSQYLAGSFAPATDQPMTLCCWFNYDETIADNYWILMSLAMAENTNARWELQIAGPSANDPLSALHADASNYENAYTTAGPTINTWHHGCARFVSDSERHVYLDGGSKGSNTNSQTNNFTPNRTAIGCSARNGFGNYFSGKIAHAAIWNVALTEAEIARLSAGALPTEIRPEALVAYWPLIDDDNDPIGGYNMTPYNSPTWSTTDYPDVFKPDKGTWEIQDILPAVIDESGFQSDGAWHIVVDTNDETKFTLDRVRIRPNIVIHDWPFQYGTVASPTNILLNHLKMDDNAANNTLTAEVGPDGSWHLLSTEGARNTSNDSVAADNFRGRALDTQDETAFGKLAVGSGTVHDVDFLNKGSVLIKVTPQFVYTTSDYEWLFMVRYDGDNVIECFYHQTNDHFRFEVQLNNDSNSITTPAYTENYSLQREMIFLFSWDSGQDFLLMAIDGQVIGTANSIGVASNDPTYFYLNADQDTLSGYSGDYIFDEIKTFSECVLPYGAYFIGNGAGLLADIDNPHADLCFFWDCQEIGSGKARGGANLASSADVWQSGSPVLDTTDALVGTYCFDTDGINGGKVTEGVVNSDLIDGSKGAVLIWVNPQSYDSSSRTFWSYIVSASYRIQLLFDASDELQFQYVANGNAQAVNSGVSLTTGVWACVKATWDNEVSDEIHLYINKIEVGTPDNLPDAWSGTGGNIAIGGYYGASDDADVKIGRVFISNNPDTPEIWTAFGKPLHVPLVDLQ